LVFKCFSRSGVSEEQIMSVALFCMAEHCWHILLHDNRREMLVSIHVGLTSLRIALVQG
jgi:hypothetical protein